MTTLWKKLNLGDHDRVVIVNSPESFEEHLNSLGSVKVIRQLSKAKRFDFLLAFVDKRTSIDRIAKQIAAKANGDAIVWFAYPKQTSKKLNCDFNRDSGWDSVEGIGFSGVRMVAIDEDWAALRFRRNEFIKSKRKQAAELRLL